MFVFSTDGTLFLYGFLNAEPSIGIENQTRLVYRAAYMLLEGETSVQVEWETYEGRLRDTGETVTLGGYAGRRFIAEHLVGGRTRSLEFLVEERGPDPDVEPSARPMRA